MFESRSGLLHDSSITSDAPALAELELHIDMTASKPIRTLFFERMLPFPITLLIRPALRERAIQVPNRCQLRVILEDRTLGW